MVAGELLLSLRQEFRKQRQQGGLMKNFAFLFLRPEQLLAHKGGGDFLNRFLPLENRLIVTVVQAQMIVNEFSGKIMHLETHVCRQNVNPVFNKSPVCVPADQLCPALPEKKDSCEHRIRMIEIIFVFPDRDSVLNDPALELKRCFSIRNLPGETAVPPPMIFRQGVFDGGCI